MQIAAAITERGCLRLLNCGALTLAADMNGDASRFKCQLMAFYFNQKCARCFSDVHTSFPCLFPMSLEVTLYCGERREEKNERSVVGLLS